jgi:hypothetical protein
MSNLLLVVSWCKSLTRSRYRVGSRASFTWGRPHSPAQVASHGVEKRDYRERDPQVIPHVTEERDDGQLRPDPSTTIDGG